MGDVLDRWRLNEGWNPRDELTQSFEIRSYVLSLNREGVPANAYQELYERAMRTRAIAIQAGKSLPMFGVELLLAHWLGENGLARERREAYDRQWQIEHEGSLLGEAQVRINCIYCLDTGTKVYDKKPCDKCKS